MKIIGITGSSGSGKSVVSQILLNKYSKSCIIDADKIARKMSNINTPYYKEIVKKFGEDILKEEDNQIDRKKLASIIYSNNSKRELLNSITFKFVVEEIKKDVNLNYDKDVIIIDAPLLFESKLDEVCDVIIGVVADEDIKIDRICKRDNIDVSQAKNRLKVQLQNEDLKKKCDFVVENNGGLEELNSKLEKIVSVF